MGEGWGEGGAACSALISLTLALSREGRGKRIKVKGVNAFVLERIKAMRREMRNSKACNRRYDQ